MIGHEILVSTNSYSSIHSKLKHLGIMSTFQHFRDSSIMQLAGKNPPKSSPSTPSEPKGSQQTIQKQEGIFQNTQGTKLSRIVEDGANIPRIGHEFRTRKPKDYDVLFGRGGGINKHIGNIHFRHIVKSWKEVYKRAKSKEAKAKVTKGIVAEINGSSGGRFLVKEMMGSRRDWTGWWIEADAEKIFAKTGQALRERSSISSKSFSLKTIPICPPPITPIPNERAKRKAISHGDVENSFAKTSQVLRERSRISSKPLPLKTIPVCLPPITPIVNEKAKRKAISQDLPTKGHEFTNNKPFDQQEVVNRPIITSMTGGHRGKQFIHYPVPSTNNFAFHQKDTDSKDAIPKAADAKDISIDSSKKYFDSITSRLIKPVSGDLTRSHSLALSDIHGFEVLDDKEKFVNPFENDSRSEIPKAKTNNHISCGNSSLSLSSRNNDYSINNSGLNVTFKGSISQENGEGLVSNILDNENISMPTETSSNKTIITTPSLLPSYHPATPSSTISPCQLNPLRRTLVRGHSLAFSDNEEEENVDLNGKFKNPFENENAPNQSNSLL